MNGGMMFSKGDIVIISFPFSNLAQGKKRPVVVLAERGDDIIACAITSNPYVEGIPLEYEVGLPPFPSKIKYWQIHTFVKDLAIKKVARASRKTYKDLVTQITKLIEI